MCHDPRKNHHGESHDDYEAICAMRCQYFLFYLSLLFAVFDRLQRRVKLMQEANIVLEVETQILHTILQHGDTLNTHTKGEA